MANFFKEEIDQIGDRLEQSIRLAGSEIQDRIQAGSQELTSQRREGVSEIGDRLDQSIRLAGSEIRERVEEISRELYTQRSLTKEDLKEVIEYAAESFGTALDQRIDKLKHETSTLVTDKVYELRDQLTAAAEEQKRNTVRNVSITILGSVLVGILSLLYQRVLHGDLNLINVFRAILFTLTCSQLIWVSIRALQRYRKAPEETKKLAFAAIHYFGIIRPQGVMGHLGIFILLMGTLLALNFWKPITTFLTGVH